MAFKRNAGDAGTPDDPVQLYRLLAQGNRGPEAVWGHQQDVLRAWHRSMSDKPDVAIELPTGAGKTLVGGLIAEFRRRKHDDRVAYLCPTKQLARQTAAKFTAYGIPNVLLINRVATWNPAHRARYEAGEAIAVSVYSHVFNSRPALDNAAMLVLDDAHAAEGYVAGPWCLTISRDDAEAAYQDVLSVLEPALDPLVVPKLRAGDESHRSAVYLASPVGVTAQAQQLEATVGAAADARKLPVSERHVWTLLQGRLDRCLVYVSHGQILIRPLIPPTRQHAAFSDPERRIYMSATLGDGGELERSFGRRKISRIPVPDGWEKQGTGRRFFLFPELTTDLAADPDQVPAFVAGVVAKAGRAIVLTPDRRTANAFIQHSLPPNCPVLDAGDVEDDLTTFTSRPDAALVLTNRYDGIDLPGNDCRLVVLAGLPARGDLQERFLHESLGAVEVLQERIRARIVQGSGRATRSVRDYAAVMVLGQSLTSYLSGRDVQAAMHPEVHAEVEFGRRNSLDTDSTSMLDNLDAFLGQTSNWDDVDGDIVANRETYSRAVAPSAPELRKSAGHEVAVWEKIWDNQWDWALTELRKVIDGLTGNRTPRRYAALWNYLGYSLADRLARQTGDTSYAEAGARYYRDARAMSAGTSWLSHLASPSEAHAATDSELDPLDEAAMRGIATAHRHQLQRPEVFEQTLRTAPDSTARSSGPTKPGSSLSALSPAPPQATAMTTTQSPPPRTPCGSSRTPAGSPGKPKAKRPLLARSARTKSDRHNHICRTRRPSATPPRRATPSRSSCPPSRRCSPPRAWWLRAPCTWFARHRFWVSSIGWPEPGAPLVAETSPRCPRRTWLPSSARRTRFHPNGFRACAPNRSSSPTRNSSGRTRGSGRPGPALWPFRRRHRDGAGIDASSGPPPGVTWRSQDRAKAAPAADGERPRPRSAIGAGRPDRGDLFTRFPPRPREQVTVRPDPSDADRPPRNGARSAPVT
ncbi:DEAD/DEAH box helicase [Embleya sp. NBC_00896]|uniref:DEAD/DEAH box helicase n=1 Tax=Embleya sp. NBC_00896 TaxID=2975961 RepID=UPI002F915E1D|nr:DEAD/DEAH box helicase family protein [Embleya sp. NBC_00896]